MYVVLHEQAIAKSQWHGIVHVYFHRLNGFELDEQDG